MELLEELLHKSNDFLVVVDQRGFCVEFGDHFLNVLSGKNVDLEEINSLISGSFSEYLENDCFSLQLDQFDIYPGPFISLFKDSRKIVLIAEDQTSTHELQMIETDHKNMKSRNKEEYRRTHVLLDESSDPIFSFKEDGTYLYVNNIFARTLGYEKEEIINRKIWDVFPKEEADKRFAIVRKVFATCQTENIEVKIPLPEGNKYFLTTVKPIKNGKNQVDFVICISKDITELRETQDQLNTLRGVLPICAACKNIRNDKGAWQELEEYISNHSEAQFSHGLCPGCAHKLYPELYKST